ncbi:YdeI/OmpD-associated family protein [Micromonospora sp. NPDC004551]|uniref:YdeI/OmpD-associated family protein n=1 Tax=Micromonospora sp. NPDC004551 TaxID=3154284 RepID=UPI0033AADAA5
MAQEPPELVVPDADAWRDWLAAHHDEPAGVWLVLARRGTTTPTSLTYDQALDEALCHGWIDGQKRRRDETTFQQRFTPRRRRSPWSARNVGIVARLVEEGRMRPPGLVEVERARADGRWDAAYAGQATAEVPADLAGALAGNDRARAMFEVLTAQNRWSIIYRLASLKRAETRARRITEFVDMLARGETPHPQKRRPPAAD